MNNKKLEKEINKKCFDEVCAALGQLVERCKDGMFECDEIEDLICDIEEYYIAPLNEALDNLADEEIKKEIEKEQEKENNNGKKANK